MIGDIRYVLMDPAKNITILVETPTPPERRSALAAELMRLEPSAEQVGFLYADEGCDIALCMAGGEFCANATMSAAVCYAMREGLSSGVVRVRVSGLPSPVTAQVVSQPDGVWRAQVELPPPSAVDVVRFSDGQSLPVVFMPGITHVILDGETPGEDAQTLAKRRCAQLHADALGMMYLDRAAGTLTPLVYVPAAGTLFWESACGSGTSAVGAYLAHETGRAVSVSLRQPGGVLEVSASPGGALYLRGTVARIK